MELTPFFKAFRLANFLALLQVTLVCCSPVGDSIASGQDSTDKTFDHSIYDALLKTYVKDGRVDYRGLKKDEAELDNYLKKLAVAKLNTLTRGERLALFINAYNAFTLKLILEHYPQIQSIKDIPSSKRWDDKRWNIGGERISLSHLEHNILREQFNEPRIHFAIVCASVSCPDLSNSAYRGDVIRDQLEKAAKAFLASSRHVKVTAKKGRLFGVNYNLYVSSILKWFSKDFGKDKRSVIRYVERYARKDVKEFIRTHREELNLKYLKYDWSLNDQRGKR